MQNDPNAIGKKKKKKKKSNQTPTNLKFWKQLGQLTQTKSDPPPYRPPPVVIIHTSAHPVAQELNIPTSTSGQNIRPSTSGQNIRPVTPGQNIRPTTSGQNIRPVTRGQNIRPATLAQNIRQATPAQNIRQATPAQNIRQATAAQNIRQATPAQNIRPATTAQNIRPATPAQNIRPSNPGQNMRPTAQGQPIRPANQNAQQAQSKTQANPNQSGNPGKPKKPKIPKVTNRTLQQLGTKAKVVTPPAGSEIKRLNPITTLVGPSDRNSANQQKKILKFQMRIQAMQQEKQRQMQMAQPATGLGEPKFVNTFVNVSGGTPTDIFQPVGMPNTAGVPTPVGVPNPVGMPNTVGMPAQNPSVIGGVLPQQLSMVPVTQTDVVETAFHIDVDHSNFEPAKSRANPLLQPQNTQMVPDQWTTIDKFGFKYPKGIPKSFLVQQQQQMEENPHGMAPDAPIWPTYQPNVSMVPPPMNTGTSPLMVQTDAQGEVAQPYSPSELYTDLDPSLSQDCEDSNQSSELSQSGQKRLSAFRRLGPQTQPKKPKLTISVTVNDDQEVREVVDQTEDHEEITPVHLREDMILSTDETVMKYLKAWPWKRNVVIKRSVTARNSKTVMMLEREQMEEIYDKDTLFVQVSVKGYPPTWKKEQVLDMLMENIRGYSFIPCFIEFTREECKFLTLRCRSALLSLHKCGFMVRRHDVELQVTVGQTELTLNQLDFVPRLVLRKRLHMCAQGKTGLDLSNFTLKDDISHFIYFPLNRLNNQSELVQVQSDITWANLTELNLSHNRITSLDGFDLEETTPKLKHLNLSYNYIEKITHLMKCRLLPLKSIHLEGNPLCTDYIDPDQYVRVVKMMFSSVMVIDDVPVRLIGDMPTTVRNYCPTDARDLVDKFLEVYYPLLDGDIEHRAMLQDMYEDHATMTVTYNYKLAFGPIYRCFKTLFACSRQLEQNKMDMLKGSMAIVKAIAAWPRTEHDPFTFTVDVLYHNEATTILRVDGVLKLTRESLAEDEYLLAFSRTVVLHTRDYVEYKIQTEMLHWSAPTGAYARSAFAVTAVRTKELNPKIDSTTDEKLQAELLKIFMKLTSMDEKISERCLEIKKWNLKEALDHFTKLLKLDSLESLTKDIS